MDLVPIIWVIAGLLIVLSELFITAFVAVFIGLGAIITGVALALGFPDKGAWPFLLFSVVTVGSLVFLRAHFQQWFKGRVQSGGYSEVDADFIGRTARVLKGFGGSDQGHGEVEYRGAAWAARSSQELTEGDRVVITGRDNLTLIVVREES